MHTVFALLCFVVVIHWLIFPYPSGLLHWHCGNLTIAPVPAKQPWWIWINTWCEFIMNDCITTTKQSTTKPCAYFLGYTVITNNGEMVLRIFNDSNDDLMSITMKRWIPIKIITKCNLYMYVIDRNIYQLQILYWKERLSGNLTIQCIVPYIHTYTWWQMCYVSKIEMDW